MKYTVIETLAVLALIITFGILCLSPFALAQEGQQQGWLEGTVHYDDGKPAGSRVMAPINPTTVTLYQDGKSIGYEEPNGNMDGLYEFHNLKPGVYEVRVMFDDEVVQNRPQRIFGVTIKSGERTVLNIQGSKGSGIEEIGQPTVTTQPVIVVSQELTRLQKAIDALKKEIDALKKK